MASLQASNLMFSSSSCCCSSRRRVITGAISVPKLPKIGLLTPKIIPSGELFGLTNPIPIEKIVVPTTTIHHQHNRNEEQNITTQRLYAILEAVCDRVEMHNNIGEQRNNWNTLLLNSINMITLTAATMSGFAATGGEGASLLALKLSSALLFSAATGMMVMVNKIQPSQLAEEQRNAVRLFKQLQREIETVIALRVPCEEDVDEAIEKVLALDRAYPLPLLGSRKVSIKLLPLARGGGSRILLVLVDHYEHNLIHKKKTLTKIGGNYKAGPITHRALLPLGFLGSPSLAAAAGTLAAVVNSFEHGGQVGMVLDMYRNCGGFFKLLEESIESTLDESEVEKRENGEMFEMKVALKLGRSLSELRDLARKSSYSFIEGTQYEEFASKLF
ncbi:hypothetical protein EZV62_026270 [Acer yangbiense]|uniref:F-box protein n=1 Tax=Acer yangbiense TaxID=1000413 RepID=A0A5C7GS25_9ROSI|nr:hypothetical protein EZV62_026270 [Acer yangbiense]